MESGFPPLHAGELHVLFGAVNKVRSGNKSNLPEFAHTAAPAGPSRPLPWLCSVSTRRLDEIFSAWKWEEADRDISLCARWLKHWTGFSFCMGVQKGNSDYRMRPGYSKFLHFIASSPQQDTHCEAGLRWFWSGIDPPIWNKCQSSRRDLRSLLFKGFQEEMVLTFWHCFIFWQWI